MNLLCPYFPQTLLVPASLKLPETPNAPHSFYLSCLHISDALGMKITINLISSHHFQKNSLILNLDYVPHFLELPRFYSCTSSPQHQPHRAIITHLLILFSHQTTSTRRAGTMFCSFLYSQFRGMAHL